MAAVAAAAAAAAVDAIAASGFGSWLDWKIFSSTHLQLFRLSLKCWSRQKDFTLQKFFNHSFFAPSQRRCLVGNVISNEAPSDVNTTLDGSTYPGWKMFRFSLIFFLANENGTGYFRDQCCHLQGDGASLEKYNFPKNTLSPRAKVWSKTGFSISNGLIWRPFETCLL